LLYADETPLFIGKDGLTKTEAFKGSIDNLRLWNIARTDEQIAEFRTLPLEGTEEGLIGYWKFDDGCNQFACDLSQNGNDGYLMGSCWCSSSFPYIPDIHAVEGALFEVPVNFCQKPSTDFQRVVMDIKYNPKLLEFLKVDLVGTAFEKWEIVTGYSPGKLKILIKNTGLALLESNTLIKLRFKALFPQLQDVIMLNSFKIDQTPLRTMSGKVVVAQPGYKEQFVEKSSTVSSYNNLLNVYPNPASNNTTFSYVLPENGQVEILIFNLNGQVVSTLVNENQVAGTYNYRADVSNLPPGIYFYTLKTGNSAISGKLIVN
jgi:hypothetical protein